MKYYFILLQLFAFAAVLYAISRDPVPSYCNILLNSKFYANGKAVGNAVTIIVSIDTCASSIFVSDIYEDRLYDLKIAANLG